MKANVILKWVIGECVCSENLYYINLTENEVSNNSWWLQMFGGIPTRPLSNGCYVYFYESNIHNTLGVPDAKIKLQSDTIYLFRVDD